MNEDTDARTIRSSFKSRVPTDADRATIAIDAASLLADGNLQRPASKRAISGADEVQNFLESLFESAERNAEAGK